MSRRHRTLEQARADADAALARIRAGESPKPRCAPKTRAVRARADGAKILSPTESVEQRALIEHRDLQVRINPRSPWRWLYAVPNGSMLGDTPAKRAMRAARAKAEGLTPGVWDLHLPMPWRGLAVPGLWVEMKRRHLRNHAQGALSDEQVDFGRAMHPLGYVLVVAYGWDEAREAIEDYIAGDWLRQPVRHTWSPPA